MRLRIVKLKYGLTCRHGLRRLDLRTCGMWSPSVYRPHRATADERGRWHSSSVRSSRRPGRGGLSGGSFGAEARVESQKPPNLEPAYFIFSVKLLNLKGYGLPLGDSAI